MFKAALRAKDNARSVRIITIVTMVFLPISMMESVFSMTVFSNEKDPNGKMTVSKEDLRWFGMATAVLLMVTFLGWGLFEFYSRRSSRKIQDEEHISA